MWQRLYTFLTRTPPLVLFQYTLFVFAVGLFALSVHVKKTEQIRDFHADKVWSDYFGNLSESVLCATPALHPQPLSPFNISEGQCALPSQGQPAKHVSNVTGATPVTESKSRRASSLDEGFRLPGNRHTSNRLRREVGALSSSLLVATATPAVEQSKKKPSRPARHAVYVVMPMKWSMLPSDACKWINKTGASKLTIAGSMCGSQFGVKAGNSSWMSVLADISLPDLKECCEQKLKSKTCQTYLASSCVGLWLQRVPNHLKRPPECKEFPTSSLWLPTFPKKRKLRLPRQTCDSSTGIQLLARQPKRHSYFLFDIFLTQADRLMVADRLSTMALCVFILAVALTAWLLYQTKTNKRIVAVDTLKM